MIFGYIRVSTEEQDLSKQKHLILEYAQTNKIIIDEFIEVEMSSRKSSKDRRIDELLKKLSPGDQLIVAELSRLGRNMLEVLNLIEELSKKDVSIIFIRQPELSTTSSNPIQKLILAIYSYFAEAEREFISVRTKQGLAAVKAKGIKLGRPKGHKNKERLLDPYREEIMELLNLGVSLTAIQKIINKKTPKSLSYSSFKYSIDNDEGLLHARHNFDKGSLLH